MDTFNKFIPAVTIYSFACLLSFSASATVADEIGYLKKHQQTHVYPIVQMTISTATFDKSDNQLLASENSLLISSNQDLLPVTSGVTRKGGQIFKFFTRFNDNLQLFFSWFSSSEKAVEKPAKEPQQPKTSVPQKTCR
ncbi:hypothetical protein LP316_13870 [Thalassotalea sp. LPB0316]|uniref:hypothetical protein n=1 Tax=Thalassotalea sp. LPB0316 TaxID=2769490 RepID=UPI001867759A|nr:hypothetical protein [Thalassotalea sp. LPB0316]QOL25369.1 hypothetical protein LP316_13870 [Thalassotalea sp. LPB0316]